MIRPWPTLLATALLLAAAVPALAQTAPASPPAASPRMACMASARSLCPNEVAAYDRLAVRACLLKVEDKVSPDCRAAIEAARAKAKAGHGAPG